MVVMTMGTATTMFAQLVFPTPHHQLLCPPPNPNLALLQLSPKPISTLMLRLLPMMTELTTMEIVLFDNTVSTVMTATVKMAVMTTVKIAVTKLAAQQP